MKAIFKNLVRTCWTLLFIFAFTALLSSAVAQSPDMSGELRLYAQDTHFIQLEAVGTVWGSRTAGYPITHEFNYYETTEAGLAMEHVDSEHYGRPIFAYGKYKLTVDYQNYVFVDFRDCDYEDGNGHGTGYFNPDREIYYSSAGAFYNNSQYTELIPNGSNLVIWDSEHKYPSSQHTICFWPKVEISGPTYLEPDEWGEFTANVEGLGPSYSYQWYKRIDCIYPEDAEYPSDPDAPPCGEWQAFGDNTATVETRASSSFTLKVSATDVAQHTVWDTHGVTVRESLAENQRQHENFSKIAQTEREFGKADFWIRSHPNPFNAGTTISFTLLRSGTPSLVIYNMYGQPIRTLLSNQELGRGQYTMVWNGKADNGKEMASGLYLCRLLNDTDQMVIRLLMIK